MNNEAIVATVIYVRRLVCYVLPLLNVRQYYDCDNITESTLSFRNAIHPLRYHRQDDNYCMYHLYGLQRSVSIPARPPLATH